MKKRIRKLRVLEVSLVPRPANQFAEILIAKGDIEGRLTKLEAARAMRDAPRRLIAKMAAEGERLRAQGEGRAYLAPLPETKIAKHATGGQRLVARAVEIAKAHRAAEAEKQAPQPASVSKASLSPAERLVEAARERAAMLRKAAG